MNPHNNEASGNQLGIQLPAPVNEQAPSANTAAEAPHARPEQASIAGFERAAQNPIQAMPTGPSLPMPAMPAGAQPVNGAVSTTTNSPTAATADDSDLIEKEWVEKAKAIVDRNRDDPYKQSEELTVFKADYMKKRYNKTIKLNK